MWERARATVLACRVSPMDERRYRAGSKSKICPSAADERSAEARDRGRSADAWMEPRIAPGNLYWTIACSIRSIRALIDRIEQAMVQYKLPGAIRGSIHASAERPRSLASAERSSAADGHIFDLEPAR